MTALLITEMTITPGTSLQLSSVEGCRGAATNVRNDSGNVSLSICCKPMNQDEDLCH